MSFGTFTLDHIWEIPFAKMAVRMNNDDQYKKVLSELYRIGATYENGERIAPVYYPSTYPVILTVSGKIIDADYAIQEGYYIVNFEELNFNLDESIISLLDRKIKSLTEEEKVQVFHLINTLSSEKLSSLVELNKEEKLRQSILKQYKNLSVQSGEESNPWDLEHEHYYAFWSARYNQIMITFTKALQSESTFFTSRKACREAIDQIGRLNFKKYILRME